MLTSGLPECVGGDESLVRFITSTSQFNAVMVKPSAFLPNPRDGKTSVFRHDRDPRAALWQLAADVIGEQRSVHAVALLTASDVRAANLEVEAHEPPPRHANIIGWPQHFSDPELARAQAKEWATVLAQRSRLLRP